MCLVVLGAVALRLEFEKLRRSACVEIVFAPDVSVVFSAVSRLTLFISFLARSHEFHKEPRSEY